jgi:hypothetical protein
MSYVVECLILGFPGGFSSLCLLALSRLAGYTPRLVRTVKFIFLLHVFNRRYFGSRGVLFCFIATIYVSFTGFNNAQPTAAPLMAVGGLFVLGISALCAALIYNAAKSLDILSLV